MLALSLKLLRLAALWLLMVGVVAGPAGVGGLFAVSACGDDCPCEAESAPADDCSTDDCDAQHSEHSDDEDCPGDCPDCGCHTSLTVALLSMSTSTKPVGPEVTPPIWQEETHAVVIGPGVFRPPRSLG